MMKSAHRLLQVLPALWLIWLAPADCAPQPKGEKLTPAAGLQIIGGSGVGRLRHFLSTASQFRAPEQKGGEQPEASQRHLLVVPEAGDFGEVGPNFSWKPEDVLTESEVRPHLKKARLWRFGAYRLYLWNEDKQVEARQGVALYHHDTLAYARKGWFFTTDPKPKEDDDTSYTVTGPAPGKDIDGDGLPDLLLYEFSGGAHCCYTVWHIECGPSPRLRGVLSTQDSEPVYRDPKGDGRFEVRLEDMSYAYWNAPFGPSPKPPVVLRISQGRYAMAPELMRAQGPTAAEMAKKTRKIRDWIIHFNRIFDRVKQGGPPPENDRGWDTRPLQLWHHDQVSIPPQVWGVMLDLIYSGRCREALIFVDAIWPAGKSGKEDFIRDVTEQVLESWFGARLPWIEDLLKAVYGIAPGP
jgi:hypothetical protein